MLHADDLLAWIGELHRVYVQNKTYLTELDAAIGDADHGINMDRGFSAAAAGLMENTPTDIAGILKAVAMVLIRTVGGASGPLYGTFFLRAAGACAGKDTLAAADVAALFRAGLEGVVQRGRAAPGDKTMVDAMQPAIAAMQQAVDSGADIEEMLPAAAAAAESGMRHTVGLLARKGRASYLGERSIGHQDPGATSFGLLIQAAVDTWVNRRKA